MRAPAQLDNIVFYTGPPSEKRRGAASPGAEEWPDIDELLAMAAQAEHGTGVEELDSTGFEIMGEGECYLYVPLPWHP